MGRLTKRAFGYFDLQASHPGSHSSPIKNFLNFDHLFYVGVCVLSTMSSSRRRDRYR